MTKNVTDLPSALACRAEIADRIAGKRPAVFLDYDGTLTPIVDRPEMAVLSESMRTIVRSLAERCTVAICSGRDLADVRKLVGLDNLVVAGNHGFRIDVPGGEMIQHEAGSGFEDLIAGVVERLHGDLDAIDGTLIEPKSSSVAVHYRLVAEADVPAVQKVVDRILAEHDDLKVTPGKMVREIQPKIDWDKGKAVLWLIEALGLQGDDVLPMFFGDDVTDEDAFRVLVDRGLGFCVTERAEERGDWPTTADYGLEDTSEVGQFLDSLAR